MPDDLARLSALIDRIYQGALEPAQWPAVLKEIADWIGASKASFFTPVLPYAQGGFTFDHGLSPELYDAWVEYQPDDHYTLEALRRGLVFTGSVMLGDELIVERDLFASAYYHDFLKIDDIPRLMTGVLSDEASCLPLTALAFYRGRRHEAFTETDRRRYRLLMPHFIRAVGTMFRLRAGDQQVAASLAALDRLDAAVLLADRRAEITYANRAALTLLAEGDGLRLRSLPQRGRWQLLARHAATQNRIDALIAGAVAPAGLDAADAGRPIAVPRPSGRAPYALHAAALPRDHGYRDFAGGGGDTSGPDLHHRHRAPAGARCRHAGAALRPHAGRGAAGGGAGRRRRAR